MVSVNLRLPILRRKVFHHWLLEIELPTDVKTNEGWTLVTFLFDAGSQLTSIPISLAEKYSIPFSMTEPVSIRGATGFGRGFLSPLTFSFPGLPSLIEFQTLCCFSPVLERPLFSLTDILNHFTFRTLRPSRLNPLGTFVLRLHNDHKGQPRT
jgi:hypothetical protein